MVRLSISILGEVSKKEAIDKVNNSNIDYLHLDVLDESMTNVNYDYDDVIKECSIPLDVHIMSYSLDDYLDKYIKLKPYTITIHTEVDNLEYYINKISIEGIKVGLAIETSTDIEVIMPYLESIDYVLVMGVELGNSGALFNNDILTKLSSLIQLKEVYNYEIGIDGGINEEVISILPSNIDILVSGSYLMRDINKNSEVLRSYDKCNR